MTHMAIVGAGIAGVTTADALLQSGYPITLFDRHRSTAMETSFANGGQLSACGGLEFHRDRLQGALRWMLNRNAPLLLKPSPISPMQPNFPTICPNSCRLRLSQLQSMISVGA